MPHVVNGNRNMSTSSSCYCSTILLPCVVQIVTLKLLGQELGILGATIPGTHYHVYCEETNIPSLCRIRLCWYLICGVWSCSKRSREVSNVVNFIITACHLLSQGRQWISVSNECPVVTGDASYIRFRK